MIAKSANERGLSILRRLGACGLASDSFGDDWRTKAYRGKSAKQVYEEATYDDLVWLLHRISREPGVVLPKAVWDDEQGYVVLYSADVIRKALPFRELRKIIWGR